MALSSGEAAAMLARDLRPGDIVLLHDAHLLPRDGGGGREEAMEALSRVFPFPAIQQRGLGVTTVGNLLKTGPVVGEPPAVAVGEGLHVSPLMVRPKAFRSSSGERSVNSQSLASLSGWMEVLNSSDRSRIR